jgi:hypothetical protein
MNGNLDSLESAQNIDEREPSASRSLPAVKVGRIVSISPDAGPLIDFPENQTGDLVPARSLISLSSNQISRQVALAFEDGDIAKPIILGILRDSRQHAQDLATEMTGGTDGVKPDQENIFLSASREITLACGKASITLTNAGKILLRGAYLLSRSSGVNRIKGGSVQIN